MRPPTAVVVGVGDELLSGVVVNSNAAMAGERLLGLGIRVVRSVCVGDTEDEIVAVLDEACGLGDVVIVTGGLGPTQDDRTREAIARLLGSRLVRDDGIVAEIRARFAAFGREMPASNEKQADVPDGAAVIPNPWGTAPGIRADVGASVLYAIPGVPGEARRMLDERILPELADRFTGAAAVATLDVRCVGLAESEIAERLADLATADNPQLAFLPGGGEIRLRFVAAGSTVQACEAMLARVDRVVRERCGPAVYSSDGRTLEEVVGAMLAEAGLTVATAESCTAGLLAGRIAAVPGASGWLRGGLVAYQSDVKASGLGVPADALDDPVSERVAQAMAAGALERFEADVALAVTCAAGPDPQGGAAPGQTVLALADARGARVVRMLRIPGDREQVRRFATTFALNLLRLHLAGSLG